MLDSDLPMFSVAGVRGNIESLIEHLKAGNGELRQSQVHFHVDLIASRMRRLLRPIPVPYKTGSRSFLPAFIPAAQSGIDTAVIRKVVDLVERAESEFLQERQAMAAELAEEALAAWSAVPG
jgi:hypothetical protein